MEEKNKNAREKQLCISLSYFKFLVVLLNKNIIHL